MRKITFFVVLLGLVLLFSSASAATMKLPAALQTIEEEAFCGNASLDVVQIPNGVTSIGERAFADSSVKIVYLPNSLTEIADSAFDGVPSLIAHAESGSYAAQWCQRKGITLNPRDGAVKGEDFAFLYGSFEEGAGGGKRLVKGTIRATGAEIITLKVSILSSDKSVYAEEIPVGQSTYAFDPESECKALKLLPVGSYKVKLTVETADGHSYEFTSSSEFTVTTPPGSEKNKTVDGWFQHSSSSVNRTLRNQSMQYAHWTNKTTSFISEKLTALGFTSVSTFDYTDPEDTQHSCGHAIGWKNILDKDGNPKRLFAVFCRGTSGSQEWNSNLTMGPGTYHEGFYSAAYRVYDHLCNTYLNKMFDEGLEEEDFLFWVTGHSRGGAVSNLLSAVLLPSHFSASQVYCYTFATPNVVRGGNVARSNIHNYIIGGDVVARVPLNAWGYGRFGVNHIYHNGENIEYRDSNKVVHRISVIDERAMTIVCQAVAPKSTMSELSTAFGTEGASLSLLMEVFVHGALLDFPAYPSISEVLNYYDETHNTNTYVQLLSGMCDEDYWSGEYLTIDNGAAPTNFQGVAESPTAIWLCWDSIGPNAYYLIRYDYRNTIGWSYSTIVQGNSAVISGLNPDTSYAFDICSLNNGSQSERSSTIHVSTGGFNLREDGHTTTSITLAWDYVEGATQYDIRCAHKGSATWDFVKHVYAGQSATFTDLDVGANYAFDICAKLASGEFSSVSPTFYASTVGFDLTATAASATSVNLTWNGVKDADSYEIRYDKANTWTWDYSKTTGGTSVTITGLQPDTHYAFDVCAIIDGERTNRSETVRTYTPELPVPADFRATRTSTSSVTLAWSAASGAELYEIRYDYKGSIGWDYSVTTAGTGITINGLEPETSYAFDICSVQDTGKSSRSSTIYATTNGLNLHSTARTETSISLAWDGADGYDAYEIRYDKKGTLTWRYAKTVSGTSTVITGLDPGTNWAFDICAIKGGNKTGYSDTIYVTTLALNAPSGFRGSASSATEIQLQWNAVPGADSYEIRYDTKGSIGWSYSTNTVATSLNVSRLEPDTTYAFDICTIKDGKQSDRSDTIYVTTLNLDAPGNFRSTSTSETSVTLAWSAASGAEAYEIRYDYKGTVGWSYSKRTSDTSVTITGLTPGSNYAFDICSIRQGSMSGRSSTIYAATPALQVPSNFRSTSTDPASVTLAWNGVSGADSYEIRYDTKGSIGWSYSRTTSATGITISDLVPGTNYAFSICTVKSGFKSDWSSTIYASTVALTVPGNFRATGTTMTSISLAWSSVNGAASYEIRYDKKGTVGWSYSKTVSGTSTEITGLDPGCDYAFDIRSVRGSAASSRSSTIYATTNTLSAPSNFRATSTTVSSVTLSWNGVAGAGSYEIRYDTKGSIGWGYSATTTGTSITITGLKADQSYAFDICSMVNGKRSDRSSTIYATTNKLSVPSNFRGSSNSSDSVTLYWNGVAGATGYKIRYDTKGSIGWDYSKTTSSTSITISGLKGGKTYAFQILSYSGSDEGSYSSTIYVSVNK